MYGDTRPAPSMDQSSVRQQASRIPNMQEWGRGKSTGAGGVGESTIKAAPEMDMRTTSAPQSMTTTQEKKPDGTVKTTTTQQKPVFKTTGSLMQRLTNPVTEQAQQGQERLQQASQAFREMAGPSRTFESIGGAGTLNQAIESGSEMDAARALANAQYQGPQGLDVRDVAGLQNLYEDISNRASALGTGGGLATLIQQSVPGLTRGQAEYEAKRRLAESKVAGRDLRFQQVNPLRQAIDTGVKGAEEFAGQRTAEEQAIRDASRGLLTGRQDVISQDIQAAINQAQAQQQGAQTAYENILNADDNRLQALQNAGQYLQSGTTAAPGELTGAEVANLFNTPGMQQTEEGRRLMDQIMKDPRYASIAGYDPLGLRTTTRGKQFYTAPGRGGTPEDIRAVEQNKATRALLYERQKELENLFSPQRGQGAFSTTNPLYYGDEYKAADPVNYLGFDPGTSPSRENVSTDVQRNQYNRITDLLGSLDQIGEKQPFRAAKIFAEADRYLSDEEAALDAKGENLSKADKEWRGMVKKARKQYKKAKKKEAYGKIAKIITGVTPDIPGVSDIVKKITTGTGNMPGSLMLKTEGY